ncbi:MAG: hypothetical protein Fur005_19000 [Roseiflexaceae bacterium]
MRHMIDADPFRDLANNARWYSRGIWPCSWIATPTPLRPPFVSAYRCQFEIAEARQALVHVSADERYELFLDGVRVGRGPERGEPRHWRFESYELPLAAGTHTLVARVWSLGDQAPGAQMSVAAGFLLAPQDADLLPILGTGVAAWDACELPGYTFRPIEWPGEYVYFAVGAQFTLDGRQFPWGFEQGRGDGWQPARVVAPGIGRARPEYTPVRLLTPAQLPAMFERPHTSIQVRFAGPHHDAPFRAAESDQDLQQHWQQLLDQRRPISIPAQSKQRILLDLQEYVAAYPSLIITAGAESVIDLRWAEALYEQPIGHQKGQRDQIEGRFFRGIGERWLSDGGTQRRLDTLWWRCGRFVELTIATAAEPLLVEQIDLQATGYPLRNDQQLAASDPRLASFAPIAIRSLQMCAHETYMDCPYWEQLMYVGDTRLQALITYTLTRDDRLPRAALRHFDDSRLTSGLTQSRFPSRVTQIITPFALWWVAMVYDYALWRDEPALIAELLPGVRGVIDGFLRFRNSAGLIEGPAGWNFMDWAPEWHAGVPPDGERGVSSAINWLFVYALDRAAQLEQWHGEPELASRADRIATTLAAAIDQHFWDEVRGLYADDLAHQHFSEHSQCLALLSEYLPIERQTALANGLLHDPQLTRTTIYFSHYLFEALTKLGQIEALFERLQLWFGLAEQGFSTTPEMPEPTRSDCHAWGAHPLYHFFASIMGIRPSSPGFASVHIAPQLGPLTWMRTSMPHPRGHVIVDLSVDQQQLSGTITLPAGISGVLEWNGQQQQLSPGEQQIQLS